MSDQRKLELYQLGRIFYISMKAYVYILNWFHNGACSALRRDLYRFETTHHDFRRKLRDTDTLGIDNKQNFGLKNPKATEKMSVFTQKPYTITPHTLANQHVNFATLILLHSFYILFSCKSCEFVVPSSDLPPTLPLPFQQGASH